jgi:hypothetical protein
MAQAIQTTSTQPSSRARQARIAHLADLICAAEPAMSLDTALLDLGRRAAEIEAWFEAQEGNGRDSDSEYEAKIDEHGELLEQIIATPTHTAAGLRVKAERIAHWCKMHYSADPEMMEADQQLGLSLAGDLSRLS